MPAYLPEDFIEEVRLANDIIDLISEYLPLKHKGKNYFGLCPFHNEKTPSFSVDPENQLYHCFGCGAGGNVFTFIMGLERLDFIDSVKFLADRRGIALPQVADGSFSDERQSQKESLYRANREAALFFYNRLLSQEGSEAREYLRSRGIDHRLARTFGLGYAPDSWDSTMNHLLGKGFEKPILIDGGLVIDKNQRTYDRFRNRIIFPIIDHRDRVVGFGGRVMDGGLPKYLNSAESLVFDKSRVLFGLNLARKQRPIDNLIVVEGYLDAITLYRYGYKNAVASLGTALTGEQAKLIRRYTKDVYIAYDGDGAGRRATLRGLDILKDKGLNVKVIKFPEGLDPDDVLRKHGSEYFQKLMDNALSLTEFKLEQIRAEYDLDDPEDKVSYATRATHILLEVENPLERDIYIQSLTETTGFKPELIYRLVDKLETKDKGKGVKKGAIGNNRHTMSIKRPGPKVPVNVKAERDLLRLMVENGIIANRVIDGLQGFEFDVPLHNLILTRIKEIIVKGEEPGPSNILDTIEDDETRGKIVEIFNLEMEYDNVDRYIDDCIERIRKYQLEKRRSYLKEQISKAEHGNSHDPNEYRAWIEELGDLDKMTKLSESGKEEVM